MDRRVGMAGTPRKCGATGGRVRSTRRRRIRHLSTPGTTGRVYVRGADYWPRFSYLNQDTETGPVEGMLWPGDMGHVDEQGYLYLTGRSSEVIIRGGVNIYPAEIENALMGIEGVEDAAVFGIPDAGDMGEAIAAHIVPRPGFGIAMDDLRTHLSGKIAGYKIPQVISIVDELPRDDSGKVYKRQLRAAESGES